MLQIEYIWKSALLVLEANILHLYIIIYMHFIRNIYIYIYIWKPALLVVYKYIYMTRVPHAIHVFCLEHIYIYTVNMYPS